MKTRLASCLVVTSLVSICSALLVPPVHAAPIAEDSFNSYVPGTGNSLVGQNDGTGWAGPWTVGLGNTADVVDTTATPLSFTPSGGSAIDGGSIAVEVAGIVNQVVVTRQFTAPLPGTFYVAYLFRITAGSWTDTDTFSLHLGANPTSTTSPNFGMRGATNMVRVGTGAPVDGAHLPGSTVLNETRYLVARFSKLDGSGTPTATYDRVEVWINPTVDDEVNNPTGHVRLQLNAGSGLATAEYLLVRAAAFEAADRVQMDQIVVGADWASIINPAATPLITGIAPASGTGFWPAANGVSFMASSTEPIDPAGIFLELNGTDVSAGLVVGGDPMLRTVSFNGLLTNVQYTGRITVSNATGVSVAALSFDTFSDTAGVVVEVEDFNYDKAGECDHEFGALFSEVGNGFQDNPPASGYDLTTGGMVGGFGSGYVDAAGYPEVDYHDAESMALNPASSVYRYCDLAGTRVARDQRRQKYIDLNLPEYEVFQMVTGDWMNYTRSFPPANYKVYLRTAGSVAGQVQLGKVSGDASTVNQTVAPAGVFLLPNTGGTNSYRYVAMTDASGQNEVTVALSGVSTIRLTSAGTDTNSVLNYLIFAPAGASSVPPVADIITPTSGVEYPAGATIPVSVTASDADGSITNITVSVSTFNSTNVIGVFAASSASFSWTNVADANYTLRAIATDNDGLQGAAVPVTIKVGNPARPALLLAGAIPLSPGDASVEVRLTFLGLPVAVKTAVDSVSADADDKQLVVISSTVLSTDILNKFTASATPVIQWESALADDFLISATGPGLGNQNAIVITPEGAAHPLGAGLPAGTNVVRTTPTAFHSASDNNLALGAVVIARLANDTNTAPTIVGVDTGATLNNGSPAAARRVNMFWGDGGLDDVNATGLSLFDAAVNWALGRAPAGPTLRIGLSGGDLTISWPASTTGEVLQESTEVANPAAWGNSGRTIDTNGTTKSVTITSPSGNLFFRLIK